MSKAFDTVNRDKLMKDLSEIISPDELHLMDILINDVTLKVKIGNETGDEFTTEKGVCQGDCISAVMFIFYLALSLAVQSLNEELNPEVNHTNKIMWSELDFLIKNQEKEFTIDPKFADDLGHGSTKAERIRHLKRTVPEVLDKRDLHVNDSKTEEYEIGRSLPVDWKEKFKYLGSFIDTEKDMKNRKGLAYYAYNQHDHIFKSRRSSIQLKMKIFNAYISSIYLYNSELWTLTKELEDQVDIHQKTLLRKALNIYWPETISNDELYKRTKQTPWSITVQNRRLSWLGHLMRLDRETPARKALEEFIDHSKRPPGKPPMTWISKIKNDLKTEPDLNNIINDRELLNTIEVKAQNRTGWRKIVKNVTTKSSQNYRFSKPRSNTQSESRVTWGQNQIYVI